MSYSVGGDRSAPPVVLLHGGGVDHARLSWQDAMGPLVTGGYRVIAPDHPGYGLSPMPAFPVTMGGLDRYLAEFIGALRLRHGLQDKAPAHLLSYLAVRVPGLLTLRQRLIRSSRWLLRQSVRQIVRHHRSLTPQLLADVAAASASSTPAFAQFQRDEIQPHRLRTNFSARLQEINQPTLIVHGSRDIGVPVAAARRAAERLPRGRLVVCQGAGHWTQRDVPERFNQLLMRHLLAPGL